MAYSSFAGLNIGFNSPGLSDSVHASDSLELLRGVEYRLHQQDVRGLNQVQTVGAGVDGQQEGRHVVTRLKAGQTFLKIS